MKRSGLTTALACVLTFTLGTAQAGLKGTYPVKIYPVGTLLVVEGSIGSTRNSVNNVEYLYCRDYGNSAMCGARDVYGNSVSCSTTNAGHLDVIRGAVDSAYMQIALSGSTCTSISAMNGSHLEPKQ